MKTTFAPVGNGWVLAYLVAQPGEELGYLRGTNVVRVMTSEGETRWSADGDTITSGDFDLPPLAGATRASVVDRIPDLDDRAGVSDLYARSVLVIAQHQEVSGALIARPGEDVLVAHALDVCGERGAAEAFFDWALGHRALDGQLMWGLEQHLRLAYGSELRKRYERLRDGPGPQLAAVAPALPEPGMATISEMLRRRNSLDLLVDEEGVDLAAHALFLLSVHALVPRVQSGEDFFFGHQAFAQEMRRARALYGGAFHGGLVAAGADPRREVEVRTDLEPAVIDVIPSADGRYRVGVQTGSGALWASDSDPRPRGQEFAFSAEPDPPDWMRDAIVYQVIVDRFARPDGPLPEPGSPTALYGGTLDGVTEHLDHIESLGCNVLWLTPVHQAPSHHGYDHEDFYAVEPRYGGEAALKRLISAAHGRGMRVLLDFVPNHTGRGHHLFRDAVARGGDAADFFRFWQWPHFYRCFYDDISLPELDTGSRRVQRYLVEVARHWVTDYGADGVRCDHVAGADPAFWIELRRGLREVKPDALVLGEATGHFDWLARYAGRLDAIFDFDFANVVRDTFARRRMSAIELAAWMDKHDHAFPGLALATLLDNHDMNRFLWMAGGDGRRLKLAATMLMTYPGTPVIYYGTEVGLTQRRDAVTENAEARLPMLWGADQDRDLLAHFRRLGVLRRESAALRRGSRRTLSADKDELVYERVLGAERIVVTMNLRSLSGSVVDGSGRDRLGQDDVLGVGPD
ncbi:MAG TPA: alpha-amylase family glycosyl hydrolase [Candidatus Limnocylindrales bacterium]|nr:alpha-amylase family glycosyl hydrolase [Candidatus Limnocylindrales bacterium]